MFKSLLVDGVKKLYTNECANDLWIREIVFPGLERGYFVEAGAADGVSGSSCFFLERQLHWTGICIEPHDDFFALLMRRRPGSIALNVCLAPERGFVDFVMAPLSPASTPFLSGVRDALVRYKHRGTETAEAGVTVRKEAMGLVDVLDANKAPSVIEYGAFDIEGSEFEVLRDFPFDRYRFLALSLEVDGTFDQDLSALLCANGYVRTSNPFNQAFPWEQYWLHGSLRSPRPLGP